MYGPESTKIGKKIINLITKQLCLRILDKTYSISKYLIFLKIFHSN